MEQFHWSKKVLFVSCVALSSTYPFQEVLNNDCDRECFSLIQSTRAFVSLIIAIVSCASSGIINPEHMMMLLSIFNLLLMTSAITNFNGLVLTALSVLSTSSVNQCYVLLRAISAQSWNLKVSDIEKANLFGQLGSILSLSCIIGPLIGSYLTGSYQNTLFMSSTMLIIGVYLSHRLLQSTNSLTVEVDKNGTSTTAKITNDTDELSMFSGEVILLLSLKFFMSFSYGLFLPVWRAMLLNTFHFTPQVYSLYLLVLGVVYALCLRFISSRIIRFAGCNQDYLLVLCVFCLSVGRILIVHTSSALCASTIMLILIAALAVVNTLLSVTCSNLTNQSHVGGVYGMLDFVESLAGIISPLVGAKLINNDTHMSLAGVCLSYLCFSILVLRFFNKYFISRELSCSVEVVATKEVTKKTKTHRRIKSPTSVIFFNENSEMVKLCTTKTKQKKN